MDKVNLSLADSREIRELLRRFSRHELEATARDYIGWAAYKRMPCPVSLTEIKSMTNEALRKFIFERDWPGYKWITKGGNASAEPT